MQLSEIHGSLRVKAVVGFILWDSCNVSWNYDSSDALFWDVSPIFWKDILAGFGSAYIVEFE